jgi:hypothetical protein
MILKMNMCKQCGKPTASRTETLCSACIKKEERYLNAVRIQFVVDNVLVAEAVVMDSHEADSLWERWAKLRYNRDQRMGCAAISHLRFERQWDVPVGSIISWPK